jgi:cytochrome c553
MSSPQETKMTRFSIVLAGLCLAGGIAGAPAFSAERSSSRTIVNRDVIKRILEAAKDQLDNPAAIASRYVGTEACEGCHKKPNYRNSMHATGLKVVNDDANSMSLRNGIIADYDRDGVDDFKQGLDFNKISSVFDKYKPNAPILGYVAGKGYTITIGGLQLVVAFAHGGSGQYKQRYVVRIPVVDTSDKLTAAYYYTPVQFNETSETYVYYADPNWYKSDNTPNYVPGMKAADVVKIGRSFNKDCAGCHTTSLTSVQQDANGEWITSAPEPVYIRPGDPHYLDLTRDGSPKSFNTGCERCHGPGLRHIIELQNPLYMVNAERDYTAQQANELCGSCHSRGASMPNGLHEYPFDETVGEDYSRHLGESLANYLKPNPGLWPDGKTSKKHHQQMQDLANSPKWNFAFERITCVTCHDPHGDTPKQIYSTLEIASTVTQGTTLKIPVKFVDNTLCLGCHSGFGPFAGLKREDIVDAVTNREKIAKVVTDHTHHSYDPEGITGMSRCTECHMAKMAASGDAYDISSHTFEAVSPEKTVKYQEKGGMPNSCSVRCHRNLQPLFGLPQDGSLTNWSEASDVAGAQWLMKYYGPNGIWWNTTK